MNVYIYIYEYTFCEHKIVKQKEVFSSHLFPTENYEGEKKNKSLNTIVKSLIILTTVVVSKIFLVFFMLQNTFYYSVVVQLGDIRYSLQRTNVSVLSQLIKI